MQSLDEETNEEENQEKLPQDYSRPQAPPDGVQDTIPEDHPALDDINSTQEWYDAGRDAEAETHDPGKQGIEGYNQNKPEHGSGKPITKKQNVPEANKPSNVNKAQNPPPKGADKNQPHIPGDRNQLR